MISRNYVTVTLCIAAFGRPLQVTVRRICCGTIFLSVLFVLSVTLVHCGQMVGWIRVSLGTEVGLGPGNIALNENPASPHGKRQRERKALPDSLAGFEV